MFILTGLLAQAAPPGFEVTKTENDCTFYVGPKDEQGVAPIRAECHWRELSPEKLDSLVVDWAGHARYFWSVKAGEELRTDGGRTLVHQTHQASGISDREVWVWMYKEPAANNGNRYAWTMEGAAQGTVAKGNVLCARDDGHWEIRPHKDGGSEVIYHLAYAPGGSVPGFAVRMFQVGGLVKLIGELRSYANK